MAGCRIDLITTVQGEASMNTDHDQAATAYFLDQCIQIESLCAELYHYYSDLFRDNEEVSRLWKKTALEEENHQKQFELAYRLREECEFEVKGNIERVKHIHQKFIRLLEHVRQNPPDIVTALQKAIEMEESIADLHMESAVRSRDAHIHDMFQAMRKFDQGHMEALNVMLAVMKLPQTEMAA
jgi:rubrerythrin